MYCNILSKNTTHSLLQNTYFTDIGQEDEPICVMVKVTTGGVP